MGSTNSTNKGSQAIGFKYQEDARAALFNRNMNGILPAGLYSLGSPVATLGAMVGPSYTGIFIKPLLVLISDNNQDPLTPGVFPRIETTTDYLVPFQTGSLGYVDVSKPYIVLRFGWAEIQANYMDFAKVTNVMDNTSTDITKMWPNDLIIGKILYDDLGSGNYRLRQTGPIMDFSKASWSFIPASQAESRELLVQSNDADPTKVYVTGGWLKTGKGKYDIAGGATVAISATPSSAGSAGRIDLVWVDESGVVQVTEGTASPAPATPAVAPPYNNKKVLAEIRRAGSRSTIEGPEIYNFKTSRDGMLLQGIGSNLDADTWDGIQSQFADVPRGIFGSSADVYTVLNAQPQSGTWEFSVGSTHTPEGAGASVDPWVITQTLLQSTTITSNDGYVIASRPNVRELWWNTVVNGTFGAWKKIWVEETALEAIRTMTSPEWQADVTYGLHAGIARNGVPYRSKTAGNLNHDPETDVSSTYWEITGGGGSNTVLGIAGENIAQFKIVYQDSASEFRIADKASQTTADVFGFATQAALASAALNVQTFGPLVGVTTGLLPGKRCYLGANGDITQVETDVAIGQCRISVGIAINATDIFVAILEPVLVYANDTVSMDLADMMFWPLASGLIPATHLPADGRLVSRSLYPDAFALIGTTFSAGDGVYTFGLPDWTNLNVVDDQGVTTGIWTIRMYPLSVVLASQIAGAVSGSGQTTLMANDLSQDTHAVGWLKSGTNVNSPVWDPSVLISQTGSLKIGHTSAGVSVGDCLAISPVFSVAPLDVGKAWKISFGFKADANYVDGDYVVVLHDGVNEIPTNIVLNKNNSLLQTVQGAAYPNASSTSYTIRIKATVARSGTALNSYIGKLIVYPQAQVQVPNRSDWLPYPTTPNFQGLGTVSGITAEYAIDSGDLLIQVKATVGTVTASEMRCDLPVGFVSRSTIPTIQVAGVLTKNNNGASSFNVLIETSKSYMTFGAQGTSTQSLTKAAGNAIVTNGDIISFSARIPCAQLVNNIVISGANDPMFLSNSEAVVDTTGVIAKSYYGVEGSPILSHTVQTVMNMSLPRALMANETIEIQLRSKIDGNWVRLSNAGTSTTRPPTSADYDTANVSRTWGIRLVKGNAGQVQVYFGSFMGINFSGAALTWATWKALADSYDNWRVRIGSASSSEVPASIEVNSKRTTTLAITANSTQIVFDQLNVDTHGAFNGTTFTAPATGWYLISFALLSTGTGAVNPGIRAVINGVQQAKTLCHCNSSYAGQNSRPIFLKAKDLLTFNADATFTLGAGLELDIIKQ